MFKAVWLTNVDSEVMSSRQHLASGLQRLADLGFNTIYPVVWQRGYTLYPSQVAQQLTGANLLPNSPFIGRDLLAEILELAAPLNIRTIPWFEYGLMVPPKSAIALNNPDLLTLDRHGNPQRTQNTNGKLDPNAWLNPCHDRVRKFTIDLITEVVRTYPVAGIQLDDHFCFPVEMGYDRYTQQLFQQDNCHKLDLGRKKWHQWGTEQLTTLLQQIVNSVKSIRPDCIVSISPNPLAFSRTHYLVDWQRWQELGLIDELVLQVYRDRIDAFKLELDKPEVKAIKTKIPTSIGILTGLRTRSIASEIIKAQVATICDRQFSGVACFFYETLFNERLAPHRISRTQSQLLNIFDLHYSDPK